MIYTIEKAKMITQQLKRFTTGYAYHVAVQFSNIDFWLNEVCEAQNTIDQYQLDFKELNLYTSTPIELKTCQLFRTLGILNIWHF